MLQIRIHFTDKTLKIKETILQIKEKMLQIKINFTGKMKHYK